MPNHNSRLFGFLVENCETRETRCTSAARQEKTGGDRRGPCIAAAPFVHHEAYGVEEVGKTLFLNASTCTLSYRLGCVWLSVLSVDVPRDSPLKQWLNWFCSVKLLVKQWFFGKDM